MITIPSAVSPSAVSPSAVSPSAVSPSAVSPSAVSPSAESTALAHPKETNEYDMDCDMDYDIEKHDAFDEDRLQDSEIPTTSTVCVKFRQTGANNPMICHLCQGWIDQLDANSSGSIADGVILFMCKRLFQIVQYDRFCLLTNVFYNSLVKNNAIIGELPQVICMPLRTETHWILLIIVSSDFNITVFYLDSLNVFNEIGECATKMANFIESNGYENVQTKSIKVPIETDPLLCGLNVVSHLSSAVQIFYKNPDISTIYKEISNHEFQAGMTRYDAKYEIEDGASEALYCKAYWGKYKEKPAAGSKSNDVVINWWPCRQISFRFAREINPTISKRPKGKNAVVWIGKQQTACDMLVRCEDITPIDAWTLDEVISICSFDDYQIRDLKTAYETAILL